MGRPKRMLSEKEMQAMGKRMLQIGTLRDKFLKEPDGLVSAPTFFLVRDVLNFIERQPADGLPVPPDKMIGQIALCSDIIRYRIKPDAGTVGICSQDADGRLLPENSTVLISIVREGKEDTGEINQVNETDLIFIIES